MTGGSAAPRARPSHFRGSDCSRVFNTSVSRTPHTPPRMVTANANPEIVGVGDGFVCCDVMSPPPTTRRSGGLRLLQPAGATR
jgi:hypothetical protein